MTMDILQETLFERLLSRYERTFGELPPFKVMTLGDAISYMRDRLGEPVGHVARFDEARSRG